jgi:hypothetical protein
VALNYTAGTDHGPGTGKSTGSRKRSQSGGSSRSRWISVSFPETDCAQPAMISSNSAILIVAKVENVSEIA